MLHQRQTIGTMLFVAPLLFLSTSCAPPLHVPWDNHLPVVSPQESRRLSPPQGLLIVYSERYDKPDEEDPIVLLNHFCRWPIPAELRRSKTKPLEKGGETVFHLGERFVQRKLLA